MSLMELIGQAEGTILYGDRSAALVASGCPKTFKAPFHGFVRAVTRDGEACNLTVTINDQIVEPAPVPNETNTFETGDMIEVVGTPTAGACGDRIGLDVGVIP